MPAGKCDHCGVEEYMPYVCKLCKGRYCAAHRLPENHNCAQLDTYKDRVRQDGRVFAPPQEARVTPRVATTARAGASVDAFWSKLDGKMHLVIIGACVAVFLVQFAMIAAGADALHDTIFIIGPDFVVRPWSLVTNIFAHASLNHLFFNMLGLFFFGSAVERLLGTKRFTGLFFGAGILAGVAQVALTNFVFHCADPAGCGALGASGAIMGITGALVVLAPTLTVLVFFVVPAPLWAIGAFYVLADLVGLITPGGDSIGHYAHLAGLAVGALYAYYLRQKGLRAIVRRAPPTMYSR